MQFKNVKMIPNLVKHLTKIIYKYKHHLYAYSLSAIENVKREFKVLQNSVLEDLICKCDINIAILFPLQDCKNLAARTHQNASSDLHIGETPATEYLWGFYLKGNVPKYVVQRIVGATESGLWKRWNSKFGRLNTYYIPHSDTLRLKSNGINGNISALFTLWLGGTILSVIIAIGEHVYRQISKLALCARTQLKFAAS
jgi:hypothetical protein